MSVKFYRGQDCPRRKRVLMLPGTSCGYPFRQFEEQVGAINGSSRSNTRDDLSQIHRNRLGTLSPAFRAVGNR